MENTKELQINLLIKIPTDVIMNNIIPYTYNTKSKEHLLDIKTFLSDYSILENYYNLEYNNDILLFDLIMFCNNGKFPLRLEDFYESVFRRHIKYRTIVKNDLHTLIFTRYHRNLDDSSERKIKFLWGLFTPIERTRFINNYIIIEDPSIS
jgi:hypothetical protein